MQTTQMQRARDALDRDAWTRAFGIAALSFLTLMAAGALLLLAGKLQFPSLGSGASPIDILRAIGLVGLACLGATVDIDGLPLSVIPLGAVGAVAWSSTRLARDALREISSAPVVEAIRVGGALALMTFVAASVFRFSGDVPVSVSPWEAAGLGAVWGSVIAALGALVTQRGTGRTRWKPSATIARSLNWAGNLGWASALGAFVALLCLIVGRLAAAPLPRWFGWGDALAAIVYLVAFLPNALVAVFSLALGGTWSAGAQVDVGGRVVGPLRELSLFDWGRGDPPAALLLLLLLPLAWSIGTGLFAAERERDLKSLARALASSAGIFVVGVMALASVSDARLGAGLVRRQGVGLVAVDPLQVGWLSLLWLAAGGAAGVLLHRSLRLRSKG